jgi:ribosomal protein S24E
MSFILGKQQYLRKIWEKLTEIHKIIQGVIFVFGFKIHTDSGKITGFGMIYNSVDNGKKNESKYKTESV